MVCFLTKFKKYKARILLLHTVIITSRVYVFISASFKFISRDNLCLLLSVYKYEENGKFYVQWVCIFQTWCIFNSVCLPIKFAKLYLCVCKSCFDITLTLLYVYITIYHISNPLCRCNIKQNEYILILPQSCITWKATLENHVLINITGQL